jgi:hypothetical protein
MSRVFLDTSGLIALVNTSDQSHTAAEAAWVQVVESRASLVTTSLVLAEIGDGLSRIGYREMAVELVDRLHSAPRVTVFPYDPALESGAWALYKQRTDKEWGITDCVSFVVMRRERIGEAFTTDHHFEQAGFRSLIPQH